MRNGVGVRLDLGQAALGRHQRDDALARLEAVDAVERGDQARQFVIGGVEAVEEIEIALQPDARFGVQHVDLPRALRLVAPADLEVVEVVRRRDLDRAGALLGIGIGIGDDPHQPADQRQAHVGADQALEPLVVGMDRDGAVAEHRLGPRRRDGDDFAGLLARGVDHRIVEVIEMAVRIAAERLGQAPPRRAARRRRGSI